MLQSRETFFDLNILTGVYKRQQKLSHDFTFRRAGKITLFLRRLFYKNSLSFSKTSHTDHKGYHDISIKHADGQQYTHFWSSSLQKIVFAFAESLASRDPHYVTDFGL